MYDITYSFLIIAIILRVPPAAAAAAAADEKNKECIVYMGPITTMPPGLPAPSPSTAHSSARAPPRAYEYRTPRAPRSPQRSWVSDPPYMAT